MQIVYKNTVKPIAIKEVICPNSGRHLLDADFRGYLELCIHAATSTTDIASVVREDNVVVGSAIRDRQAEAWTLLPFMLVDLMQPYLNPKAIDRQEFRSTLLSCCQPV